MAYDEFVHLLNVWRLTYRQERSPCILVYKIPRLHVCMKFKALSCSYFIPITSELKKKPFLLNKRNPVLLQCNILVYMVCENRSTETETTKIYNIDRLHQVTFFFSKQEPIKVSPCSYVISVHNIQVLLCSLVQ